jgi:general stress protein YciG
MKVVKQGTAALPLEQRLALAKKGGLAVSQNRAHMAEIGRKGGVKSGEARRKQKEKRDGLSQ